MNVFQNIVSGNASVGIQTHTVINGVPQDEEPDCANCATLRSRGQATPCDFCR